MLGQPSHSHPHLSNQKDSDFLTINFTPAVCKVTQLLLPSQSYHRGQKNLIVYN